MSAPAPSPGSPPSSDEFRLAMRRLPAAVTVITAIGSDEPLGATASAVTSLSLDPPMMLACLDRGSRTLGAIEEARRFAINVLADGQADLARRFSTKDPHDEKWADVGWERSDGVPRIDGVALWIACELGEVHRGGDHLILTGSVLAVEPGSAEPLVVAEGAYRAL